MKRASFILCAFSLLVSSVSAAEPLTPADLSKLPPDVERIELYLLIGQSNMKGRGEVPAKQAPNPRILMMHLRTDQWYFAQHPLHAAGDPVTGKGAGNEGVGPGLAFAQALAVREPHVLIGLIPCAVGGTRLELWMKGGRLYENAVRRARLALGVKTSVPVAFKGALWLQGEADAKPNLQPTYQERLARMIDDLRAELALPNLPFIAATIGSFDERSSAPQSYKALINDALLALPKLRPHTACVDARDLKGHIGDNVHYNAASANTIGERMAEKYLALTKK
jgi:hypothetical protein